MGTDILSMVVIHRATLVLGTEIFQHNGIQPVILLQIQLQTHHNIFQAVEKITVVLFHIPLIT